MTADHLKPFIADHVDIRVITTTKTLAITLYQILVVPDPELVEQEIYGAGQEHTGGELMHIVTPVRHLPAGINAWRSSKHIGELAEDLSLPLWAEQLIRNVADLGESSAPLFELAAA